MRRLFRCSICQATVVILVTGEVECWCATKHLKPVKMELMKEPVTADGRR